MDELFGGADLSQVDELQVAAKQAKMEDNDVEEVDNVRPSKV